MRLVHENFEFLVLDGFSNMVLASALEPLRDVKMRALYASLDWEVTTFSGSSVTSSSNLKLSPDRGFAADRTTSTLVIVAGYSLREQITKDMISMIRQASRNARRVLALDTAPWLLAKAGILDGHKATIHWQELEAFEEAFPNVHTSRSKYVVSGQFMTCGGASTALEMMLELIRETFGPAAAFDASNMFVFDAAGQRDQGRTVAQLRNRGSPILLDALNIIAENVEHPLTVAQLAERILISERTLNRTFSEELGMSVGKYSKLFRLQHARYLVQETYLGTDQIALQCGFSCASALRRSFANEFGRPIRSFRTK